MSERRATWMVGFLILLLAGCRGKTASAPPGASPNTSPTHPATLPATTPATITFDGSKYGGILLDYPARWVPTPNKEYVLFLLPPGASTNAADRSLSLDVPDLPPHVPGLIPFTLVKNGYISDLRKQHPDLQAREPSPPAPQPPHTSAAFVLSTWSISGKTMTEAALILLHGDHVYILRANYDADGEAETRRAYDAMTGSVRWAR
jgi:hypothetical protein